MYANNTNHVRACMRLRRLHALEYGRRRSLNYCQCAQTALICSMKLRAADSWRHIKRDGAIFFLRLFFTCCGYTVSTPGLLLNLIAQAHTALSSAVEQRIYACFTALCGTAFTSVPNDDRSFPLSLLHAQCLACKIHPPAVRMRMSWHEVADNLCRWSLVEWNITDTCVWSWSLDKGHYRKLKDMNLSGYGAIS